MSTVTINLGVGLEHLTGKEIGKMIQQSVKNATPSISVVSTPTSVDVYYEKTFSDITIMGSQYERMKKLAKARGVTVEQLLKQGAKRYGEKV